MSILVSTHSRPKAAGHNGLRRNPHHRFQHTAARRRLVRIAQPPMQLESFNTQPPEGGWLAGTDKAFDKISFNTQPPEGGWGESSRRTQRASCFNTQPPEGGWDPDHETHEEYMVSTHSRPKAAGTKREFFFRPT